MASKTIVGQLTYFPDNDVEDTSYNEREGMVEIMKDRDSGFVEIALEPDAQKRTVDRLHIKVSVHDLMLALADVLMQKEDE